MRAEAGYGMRFAGALLLAVVAALALSTVLRNRIWADPVVLWTDTAAKSPRKVRPLGRLGNAYAERRQYQEALWCYQRALQLEPSMSLKAYGNIGNVYIDMQEYDTAVGVFTRILSINADDELSYIGRGKARFGLGQYEAARADFDRAIARNPAAARYYFYRGEALLMLAALERGRADVQQACDMGWEEACDRLRELPAQEGPRPAGAGAAER